MNNPFANILGGGTGSASAGLPYELQLAAAQRQQRLAEQLQQESQQAIPVQQGGGAPAPISWGSILGKVLQSAGASAKERHAQDLLAQAGTQDSASAQALARQLTAQQPGTPSMPAQQTMVNGTAPQLPGGPAPMPVSAQGMIPGQAGGQTQGPDMNAQLAAILAARGGPQTQMIQQAMLPQILQRQNMDYQHGVQRQDKLDDNAMPMSTAMGQQIAAQGAQAQSNEQFKNNLPQTANERATTGLGYAKLGEERSYHQAQVGGNISVADPQALAYAGGVQTGNMTFQSIPKPYKNSVAMILQNSGDPVYSPLSMTRNTLASERIAAPFKKMPQYDLTAGAQVYLDRINAALAHPGSVADQDLLDSLTKLNTSGNAITDAQVRLITAGKSLGDQFGVWSNALKNGGVLSENQRNQVRDIANNIAANYRTSYQPVYDAAAKQLTAAKIPKQFWTIPDLNSLSVNSGAKGGPAATAAAPGANIAPAGTTATGPGGKTLTSDGKGGWH